MSLKKQINGGNSYETERLLIRPISPEDGELIFKLYNSPKFIQYIGDRNIKSIADAEEYIKSRFLPQFERLGFGNYLVMTKDGNEKIGGVGIFEREGLDIVDIRILPAGRI
ncbi:GNAT family N-acetyltransferase [Chryseobacterium flavum]|uniref:GNAT family N-acetyltransferase n=1 Tax=Chryseobacterium flavum TaxID=415851 RepID=UPI002FD8964D